MEVNEFEIYVNTCIERAKKIRQHGRSEYANDSDVFGNFKRLSSTLNIPPEVIAFIYGMKHWDGISSYIKGHKHQRDTVHGRFDDLHNYLWIMEAIIHEKERDKTLDPSLFV